LASLSANSDLLHQLQTWPLWWRISILVNVSFYNLLGNAFAAGITPLFQLVIEEFHCTAEEASQLSTYALLALGLSVSGQFGTRCTY